jgi:pimeloyl-ACP methyl ester carboxylesterase
MIQSVDAGVNRLTNTQSSSQDRSRRRQLSSVQSQVNQSQAIQVQGITRDAPYSVNRTAIESSVNCLNNTILGRSGGIIILVSGTGSTGNESFGAGPYTQLLPFLAPGFDVCLLDLPDRSQGDAQVTSEYIAGNIIPLAKKSRTGKVSLIGHSQGNLNIQWALNFWPSTRPFVHHYVS